MNKLILTVILIFISNGAIAANGKIYEWRLAQTWPKDMPLFGDVSKEFARIANELSGGRIVVTIDAKEDHNRALGVFKMVKEGEYQMGHSASYYWKNIDINTQFFATVPFGMIAVEQYAWFYYGGGLELMEKTYKKHGLLSFPGGNTANQMGGWFLDEVKSLEDMKGLRMRIPGIAGDIVKGVGSKPIVIPGGDLFDTLKDKKIDGLEWVGPSIDLGMNFHKIAKYYYTGWHEPATMLQFLVNKDAYDSLPKDLQNILKVSMKMASYDNYIDTYHRSAVNLKVMLSEYPDIKVRAFPTDVIRALKQETQKLLEEIVENGDSLTKEIVQSITDYKKDVRLWTRISDQAYLNN